MHTCKTKTYVNTTIHTDEYQVMKEKIAQGSFLKSMDSALDCVSGGKNICERHVYQAEFHLPMKRNIFGLLSIPIYVNHKKCTFLIDTGAQISGLRSHVVKRMKLKETGGSLSVGSIGGKEKVMPGLCVDSFQLGGIEYRKMPMIALSDDDFTMRLGSIDLFGFDGILGWDILSKLDFELDDIAKEFKVLKNRYRFDNPNMILGGFPVFLVKNQDGKLAIFGFDSGSKVSWIGENAITTHSLDVIHEGKTMGFGVHGLEEMDMKIIKHIELYLDRAKITLKDTMTGRTNLFDSFTFDGVFGNEISKGRRIRIINSKSMVLLV